MWMYMYIYTQTYICAYMYTYVYIHIYIYIHVHVCAYIYMYVCTCTRKYAYDLYIYFRAYTHTYHIYTSMWMHASTRMRVGFNCVLTMLHGCLLRESHPTLEWAMSHMNEPCRTWMSHVLHDNQSRVTPMHKPSDCVVCFPLLLHLGRVVAERVWLWRRIHAQVMVVTARSLQTVWRVYDMARHTYG